MAKHFTKREIDEIEQALIERSKKDTSFPEAESLSGDELIPIVQDGENRRTTYSALEGKFTEDVREYVDSQLDTKVDKVPGKGLSSEDYTTVEKQKLAGIEAGAEVNVNADWDASSGDAQILNKPDLSVYATKASVEDIEALIPSQASSSNQLADKDFVNSTVSTNTADFKGTFNSTEDLEQVTANNNDYAFVVSTDAAGNTVYNRYKYTESTDSWLFEYALNNSSFTAAQWAAIQSGITSSLVTKLSALPTSTELSDSLNTKVDKVTGKGLSTNDYTTTEKNKLAGVETGAQVNDIEHIKIGSTEQTISEKTVSLPASYPKADIADVAINNKTELKANQEFKFRKTNVDWDAKTEIVKKIYGKTLAWNQIYRFTSFPGDSVNYCSYDTATNTFIITNAQRGYFETATDSENSIISGHKYYLAANVIESTSSLYVFIKAGSSEAIRLDTFVDSRLGKYSKVHTTNVSGNIGLTCWVTSGKTIKFQLYLTDLTLLYGSEIDGMTDEQILAKFESEFPGYHSYNPGELISNDAESIETVGFNQWDEEYTLTGLNDDGTPFTGNTYLTSKNYIQVKPNTTYYFRVGSGYNSLSMKIIQYDANKTKVGTNISKNGAQLPFSFTTDANCYYIKFNFNNSYGTTYNHDICINISDPSRNGQYEPYKKSVCPLNIKTRKGKLNGQGASVVVFPDGMNGVGTSFDEANRTKGTKRRARVNLGDLIWMYRPDRAVFSINNASMRIFVNNSKVVCDKYVCTNASTVAQMEDKSVGCLVYYNTNDLIVKDSSYSDAATFKAAMDGVYLDYELAEPQEYVWDEPIANLIPTDRLGTERAIYPESDTPSAPFVADIQYGANSDDIIDNYDGVVKSLKNKLETLWNAVFNNS